MGRKLTRAIYQSQGKQTTSWVRSISPVNEERVRWRKASPGRRRPCATSFAFNVPLLNLPGRGLGLSLGLTHNSRIWHKPTNAPRRTALTFDVDSGSPAPGFRLGYGYLESHGDAGWTLVDASGKSLDDQRQSGWRKLETKVFMQQVIELLPT